MKIRNGFVSNSSSSSFIIGFKGNFSQKTFKEKLIEKFAVPEGHPLEKIAKITIDQILSDVDLNSPITTEKEYLKELGYKKMPDEDELNFMDLDALALLKQGWTIISGSFYDEDCDGIDLTQAGFEIKDDDFCFYSQEGY
jgi:hypothetical protein